MIQALISFIKVGIAVLEAVSVGLSHFVKAGVLLPA